MSLRPDVIAWVLVYALWLGKQHVSAAPTSVSATDTSPISASTSTRPTQSSNPYPYGPDPSNDNSSPMTTIIIVCVVGSLALIGTAWGTYRCIVTRRRSPAASVLRTTDPTPTTAIIYIPGDAPVMTAMPSLAYSSPPVQIRPDLEVTEVGPGVVIPPPPAYDVATGGRVPDCETGASLPCRPVRERTESRWKDLLVAQGRD